MRKTIFFILILLGAGLQGCSRVVPPSPSTPTSQTSPGTILPTATTEVLPTSEPTPTSRPAAGILYAPPDTAPWLAAAVEGALSGLPGVPILTWETRTTLAASDLTSEIQLVVALPPMPDLNALAASAPMTQFVAVGIVGLQPGPNLTRLGPEGLRPDQQAFLAGYLAAVITDDWRVGVISPADTAAGRAARQGFLNGVRFFCGLCLPEVPPYAGYPLFVDLAPAADPTAWQAAADLLLAEGVKTIYLEPTVDQEALRKYLAEKGAVLVGGATLPNTPEDHWAATIEPDIQAALEEIWPGVLSAGGESDVELSFRLTEVNETLISPGRQRLVGSLIPDLASGLIDTGVDPLSGEIQ